MKRKILLVLVLILVVSPVVLLAEAELSSLYPKTALISKIYPHKDGYKVVYVKSDMTLGVFYVPIEWFQEAGGKAEIMYGNDKSLPYFTAFYKHEEGTFDHIRLHVYENYNNITWGSFDKSAEVADRFEGIETLNIEY